MTCKDLVDFLMDYVDGKLPPAQLEIFERHMSICSQCVEFIDTYKRTVDATRAAWCDDDDIPDEVPEPLVKAILDARKGK